MNESVAFLMTQLKQFAQDQTPIDIAALMIHFTIDFLTITMFNESFGCSKDFDKPMDANGLSDGKQFLHELSVASKEFVRHQAAQPLREYCFWNNEVQRGKLASKRLSDFALKLLKKYRDTHTAEEIKEDTSIIGHLVKR
jgi:hypothetical protein